MTFSLHAATMTSDITPDGKPDLCGFARRSGPTAGIHDPLHNRALYLTDGESGALISASDLIGLSVPDYQSLRDMIKASAAGPLQYVNITTSHTHSGPATSTLVECGTMDPGYMETLRKRLVDTASGAIRSPSRPVRVEVGTVQVDLSYHRRDPAGAVDRELLVVTFVNAQSGKPVATLVNYACHPVVLGHENLLVSGDYPAFMQSTVEVATGAPCLFMNGACGDINPSAGEGPDPGRAIAMGETLAALALGAQRRPLGEEDLRLTSRVLPMELPVRCPESTRELEQRAADACSAFELPPHVFADQVAAACRMLDADEWPRFVQAELSLVTLGSEVALVFVPGEIFAETGLRIKRMSPFRHTLVCGYSNGSVGYIPTRQAFREGWYEAMWAHHFYGAPEWDPSVEEVLLAHVGQLFEVPVIV